MRTWLKPLKEDFYKKSYSSFSFGEEKEKIYIQNKIISP